MSAYEKSFLDLNGVNALWARIKALFVPNTRTVNGQALSSNVTIATPGTLKTNATTAQTASSGEVMSGTITLHKVAKTGTYSDLIGTPTIPTVNNAALKLQLNGGTATSKFTANASTDVTLAFASGSTAGTIKVDSTEIAVAGFSNKADKASVTAATKCKITYNAQGIVTAGADLAASDIPNLPESKITTKYDKLFGSQGESVAGRYVHVCTVRQTGDSYGVAVLLLSNRFWNYQHDCTDIITISLADSGGQNTSGNVYVKRVNLARSEANVQYFYVVSHPAAKDISVDLWKYSGAGNSTGDLSVKLLNLSKATNTWGTTVQSTKPDAAVYVPIGGIIGNTDCSQVTDANNARPALPLTDTGLAGDYYIGTTASNTPNSSYNFHIHATIFKNSSGYKITQIAVASASSPVGIMYIRSGAYDGTTWSWGNWTTFASTSHNHDSVYLKLAGGTMTGKINAWASQYTDDGTTGAIDMKNSNIVGLNSLYTADASDGASEGIHFFRETGKYDTLWMAGGHMYFVPNRAVGTSTSAANSKKVAILPASITSGHVVVTDGTSGDVKGVAASSLTVGTASKLISTLSNSGTIDPTNIVWVTGSTDGFKMDYSAATADAGKMTIYTTDDANAAISIGNTVSGTYKEAISVVDGSANVKGTVTTQYHGYAEFSNKTNAYGLLATIDTSGMGGNWDIHAIFSIQHIQDTGTNYPGDQKLVVDIRTNGDATSFSYYATNLTRGINNSAYSIKMYRDSSYTNVRIYAYGGAANTYGSVIIRLESCTNWFGSSLVSRITLNRGAAGTTTPTGTSLTVTEREFLDTVPQAAHLGSYGTARTWPYQSSTGKPYALLANKGVATNKNWGFGQLFKLEVANAFVIFKVSVKGSSSAVIEASTDVLYFCNMTRAQLEQILVVRYGFTANSATNGAIVAIYADMSKVASYLTSVYTRATLRQLDNQSDDQYAYEHWNSFTFFTDEMYASVGGAAPTMNVLYYTKAEIDGAFSVVNNNITSLTQPIRFMIAYPQKITVYSESMVLINEYTNTSAQFPIQTTLDYAKANYVKKIHIIINPSASGTSTIYMQSTGPRNAQFFDKSRYELTIQNISGYSYTIRIQIGGRLDSTGYYDCWNINHDGVVDMWQNTQDNQNTHFHELGTIGSHNCKSWEIVIPPVNVGSNWNTVHMNIATLK